MEEESIALAHPESSHIIDANLSNSNIKMGGGSNYAANFDQPYVQAPTTDQQNAALPLQISKGF